tara:strand:- start:493 stop:618 length:126 start_codon:yes stop_codon:yes gene_type:complete
MKSQFLAYLDSEQSEHDMMRIAGLLVAFQHHRLELSSILDN